MQAGLQAPKVAAAPAVQPLLAVSASAQYAPFHQDSDVDNVPPHADNSMGTPIEVEDLLAAHSPELVPGSPLQQPADWHASRAVSGMSDFLLMSSCGAEPSSVGMPLGSLFTL